MPKMENLGSWDLKSEMLPGNKNDTEGLMKCSNQVQDKTKSVYVVEGELGCSISCFYTKI